MRAGIDRTHTSSTVQIQRANHSATLPTIQVVKSVEEQQNIRDTPSLYSFLFHFAKETIDTFNKTLKQFPYTKQKK